jgi:hypothetical protein
MTTELPLTDPEAIGRLASILASLVAFRIRVQHQGGPGAPLADTPRLDAAIEELRQVMREAG